MKFSTTGRNGKNTKSIRVSTSDPDNAKFSLKISGEVTEFAAINPKRAVLKGMVGDTIRQVVTVIPNTKDPFVILHSNTLNQDNFRFSLKETEVDGKKTYEFLVENTKSSVGRYMDKIFIFTDKMERNPITIVVSGDIREKTLELN